MRYIHLFLLGIVIFFASCEEDEERNALQTGTFEIEFDHMVGAQQVSLAADGDTNYPYTNGMGQPFNVSMLGYSIRNIVLEGPNGERYVHPSSNTYQVQESNSNSLLITLENIPKGKYNQLSFVIGTEGNEANAFDFIFEGQSPDSPGNANTHSLRADNPNSMAFHLSNQKELEPVITLKFDLPVPVQENFQPHAHIVVDIAKVFMAQHTIDFSKMYNVNTLEEGYELVENLQHAFIYDHRHL